MCPIYHFISRSVPEVYDGWPLILFNFRSNPHFCVCVIHARLDSREYVDDRRAWTEMFLSIRCRDSGDLANCSPKFSISFSRSALWAGAPVLLHTSPGNAWSRRDRGILSAPKRRPERHGG